MSRIRQDLILVGSFVTTCLVIGNAFYHKKQFYPSIVHITKSNGSMAVLYFQALVLTFMIGKLMNKIFFGQLRAIEIEHLMERSWFALTETCLAFTVFRDDFSPKFVTLFIMLFFFKCFHWLAEDRVDYMERSPIITLLFHARILALSALLMLFDAYFVYGAYQYTIQKGASVQIVFGFEYAVLFVNIIGTFIKYLLHTIDSSNENPWENKGIYMLYSDLFLGFTRVVLYFTFIGIMIKIHTFPLFAIRPIYLALRSFKKCLSDVVLSRRAISNLNNMYPDVSAEQLSAYSDTICIICREEMTAEHQIKKLPCDHIFHKNCLRSWFQRQQTCPTCRTSILRANPAHQYHQAQNQPQPQPQQQQQQQPIPTQQPTPTTPHASRNITDTSNSHLPQMNDHAFNPYLYGNIMPPFMFPPPPLPDINLAALSDEELAQLEGNERRNMEARVQCLRNINTLLNGSFLHIQQYMNITMADSHLANLRHSSTASATDAQIKVENDLKEAQIHSESTITTESNENSAHDESNNNENDVNVLRKRRLDHFNTNNSPK